MTEGPISRISLMTVEAASGQLIVNPTDKSMARE